MALTEEQQQQSRQAVQGFMFKTPYIEGMGMVAEQWNEEGVRIRLPFDKKLSNDGRVFHGGAIASLMDTAGAAAVWAGHDFDKGAKAATVNMAINYLGAAYEADLIADAVCVKRGKELAFSEIRITDPEGKPVATGTLVYRIVP
ncbi:MAG TPA: PaaI family thioesterase [Acidimicrobiia bacterium]|nr:PaaI family thioesterase [Acidimicrobiia bacterium]